MPLEVNALMGFLTQVEADRRRREQEAAQKPAPVLPKWSKTLNPDDFTGQTRDLLTRAQAEAAGTANQAGKGDLAYPSRVDPKGDRLDMPETPMGAPGGFSGGYGAATGLAPPMEPQTPAPAPMEPDARNAVSAASEGATAPNLRQALGPHVGGAGGSYIDMMRQNRQTGALPDMRGMMGQPGQGGGGQRPPVDAVAAGGAGGDGMWNAGQSPSAVNASARQMMGGQGGGIFGGSGPGLGDMLGGIGAMLKSAGGDRGAVDQFLQRRQARQAQAQELARFNKTAERALEMGIDPDYVMTLYETRDMGELAKAIHDERKFTRDSGKPTDEMREYQLYKEQGGALPFYEYKRQLKQAGATNISTTVGGEKIPEKMLQAAIDSSNSADTLDNQVQELGMFRDQVMQTPTGWAESVTFPARRAMKSMGLINDENVSSQELVTAMQNQQALRLRNPESGFGLTGNTSDRDVRFLKETVAGLEKTEQGNVAMLTVMMAKQRRDAQIERLKADYIFENGTLKGWGEARKRFVEATPLFDEQESALLTGLKQQTGGAAEQQAPVQPGQGAPPAGVEPELWQNMTPEERALWQ